VALAARLLGIGRWDDTPPSVLRRPPRQHRARRLRVPTTSRRDHPTRARPHTTRARHSTSRARHSTSRARHPTSAGERSHYARETSHQRVREITGCAQDISPARARDHTTRARHTTNTCERSYNARETPNNACETPNRPVVGVTPLGISGERRGRHDTPPRGVGEPAGRRHHTGWVEWRAPREERHTVAKHGDTGCGGRRHGGDRTPHRATRTPHRAARRHTAWREPHTAMSRTPHGTTTNATR
jgi:hypothetical protein